MLGLRTMTPPAPSPADQGAPPDPAALKARLAAIAGEEERAQAAIEQAQGRAGAAFAGGDGAGVSAAFAARQEGQIARMRLQEEREALLAQLRAAIQPQADAWAERAAAAVRVATEERAAHEARLGELLAELDRELQRLVELPATWERSRLAWQAELDAIRREASPASVDAPTVALTVAAPDLRTPVQRLGAIAMKYQAALPWR